MGVAIDALADVWTLLKHNPIILGVGWIATMILGVANIVLSFIPLLGRLISLFLWPAFLAAMLGLIYAGRNGNASVSDAVDSLSDHYPGLLGGSFLVGIVLGVVWIGGMFLTVFVVTVDSSSTGTGSPMGMAGAFLLPIAAIGLFTAVLFTVLQFFDVAIVVDDAGIIESFTASARLLTAAPVSVLGYTVLRFGLGAVFFVVPVVGMASLFGSAMSLSAAGTGGPEGMFGAAGMTVLALALVWFLVLIPLGHVVNMTYHVAFYNRHKAIGTL